MTESLKMQTEHWHELTSERMLQDGRLLAHQLYEFAGIRLSDGEITKNVDVYKRTDMNVRESIKTIRLRIRDDCI